MIVQGVIWFIDVVLMMNLMTTIGVDKFVWCKFEFDVFYLVLSKQLKGS